MEKTETTKAGWGILMTLTAINLLNYVDRYVISAVLPLMKGDLALTDTALGTLATAFIVSYLIFSPFAGQIGDRFPRKYLVAVAVFVWSLATVASGLSRTYHQLILARAFTGIGEAGYATVAPSMISDVFPKARRGSALSIFYAALPVGSAIGFTFGGFWGTHFGWRSAFFLAGGPGMAVALLALLMREPTRGGSEGVSEQGEVGSPFRVGLELLRTPSFLCINLGMAAYTFAIGGLAFWAPTFLNRVRGIELAQATWVFGLFTVVAGFGGTMLGGIISDRVHQRLRQAYVLIPGISLLLAFPPLYLFFGTPKAAIFWPLLFVAVFFLFMNTGPLNAALLNVVLPRRRARAMALNILVIHLLGDALSPLLIGRLSDAYGLLRAMEVISFVTVLSAAILIYGSRYLVHDEQAVTKAIQAETKA